MKTMDNGIVDSPSNCNAQLVIVSSPLPLRSKSTTLAHIWGSFGDSRFSCKLYDIQSSSLPYGVVKIFFKTFIAI